MPNLLNSYGRTKTWVDNGGLVLFESAVPQTHIYTFPRKTKCGIICVGGGAGGFAAPLGFGADGSILYGNMAYSGGSGGYSYVEHVFEETDTITISVGAGGSAYYSSSAYGAVTPSSPNLYLNVVSGQPSSVSVGGSDICVANAGGGGRWYLSDPSNPNSVQASPSLGGSGTTTNGNNGVVATSGVNYVAGGVAVYENYGTGGNATRGSNATSGVAGYVKIFILATDNI